jgi:DNA-binding MarR family transcriptional regulator
MLSKKIIESVPQAIRVLRLLSVETLDGYLSLQQLRVLRLAFEGYGQSQISKILQVSMAATSKMVDSLCAKGLLIKKEGKDKRSLDLKLTPKGRKILNQVTSYVERKINDAAKNIEPVERDQLMKGLAVLDKIIQKIKKV